jgi:hypothetical protein
MPTPRCQTPGLSRHLTAAALLDSISSKLAEELWFSSALLLVAPNSFIHIAGDVFFLNPPPWEHTCPQGDASKIGRFELDEIWLSA